MADREASTIPEGAKLRDAAPEADPLAVAVDRARVEAALFGESTPIKVGRYVLIERAGAGGMGVVWRAWDPELGRAVALKLAASGDRAFRARVLDEGRALAKLSHPNVVPIYDVIDAEQGVFLVMELVEGQTLRALAVDERSPIALVRAYRQAGEGLAAAHAAGLVHRDFKPDNAILGDDGRVRVLDFGLAHEVGDTPEISGTPKYMPPEQRAGKPLGAAADQYALCVSLREALRTIPRWLEPILARGTAEDPAERYPSLELLLHDLARDPGARWRRRALIGGAVVAVAAVGLAFTLGRAGRDEVATCDGGPQAIAGSWGPDTRVAVATHLARHGSPYAAETAPRVLAVLDAYAGGWLRVHRGSCEAHQRGELSSDLFDRRTACLARRRGALATLAELARSVAPPDLPQLVTALGELPDIAACEDDAALVSPVAPPPRELVGEATAITELIARVDVERDAGRFDTATRDSAAAVARARALGYRPLIARALLARGRVALAVEAPDRGASDFEVATREAVVVGHEQLAIEAFARHAYAIATTKGPAQATGGLAIVDAMIERLGERARFERALLRQNLAAVAMARGDHAAARPLLERARIEAAGIGGSGAIELTAILSNLVIVTADPAIGRELIAARTRLLGASHPSTLVARTLVAGAIADPAAARAGSWPACQELARYHPGLGSDIGECGYETMWLATIAGDRDQVRAAAALVGAAKDHGAEAIHVGSARAYAALANGDGATAVRELVEVQAVAGREPPAWWNRSYIADALLGEALARHELGERGAADAALARAEKLYAEIAGSMPPPVTARRTAAMTAVRARFAR